MVVISTSIEEGMSGGWRQKTMKWGGDSKRWITIRNWIKILFHLSKLYFIYQPEIKHYLAHF